MNKHPTWTKDAGINTISYNMQQNDISVPFALSGLLNKSVSISGVFSGAVIKIRGKDSGGYVTIKDVNNAPMSFNSAISGISLGDNPSLINVDIIGGDINTDIQIVFSVN